MQKEMKCLNKIIKRHRRSEVELSFAFLWTYKYKQTLRTNFTIFIHRSLCFLLNHQVFRVICLPLETIIKYIMSQTVLQYSAHCCVLDRSWNRVLFAWDWDKTVKNVLDSEMRPSKRGLDSGLKCGLIGAIMRTTQHLTVAGSTMTRELVCRCCAVTSVADISGKYQTSHQQPAATGPREPGPAWSNQSSHPNPI